MYDYKKVEKYYDNYGSWYDQERISGYYALINELETAAVLEHARDKTILEIGCGTGIILEKTSNIASEAVGIDLSEGMLAAAQKKGLKVQKANATSLPFRDNRFDLVYSFKVLAHIPEISQAISEIVRVVKPEGILILEFYNPYSLKHVTNSIYNKLKKRRVFLRFDSLAKIKSYLPKNATIIETRGIKVFSLSPSFFQNKIFLNLERRLSTSFFKYLAGYFIVTVKIKK